MSYPRRLTASAAVVSRAASAAGAPRAAFGPGVWNDGSERRPQRLKPLTRRYEVAYLTASGQIEATTRLAPALPQFEDAFSAIARRSMITTDRGAVPIEDLVPGTRVLTLERGPEPVVWIGSMTLYPAGSTPGLENPGLIRVTADRFGYARPTCDLILGPNSRILHRHARMAELIGTQAALAPARGFVDGMGVIRIDPISPVTVYHIAFAGHRTIRANGIEIESFHPGVATEAMLDPELMALFLAFFPHIRRYEQFGPLAHPRLTTFEVETILAS